MRVKVNQIPKGLDRDHSPRYAFLSIQGLTEKLLERLVGTLAEPPQELSIESKIGPQHLRDSKQILSMRYGVEDFPQPKRQSCSWYEPTESDIRFSESVKPSQGLVW